VGLDVRPPFTFALATNTTALLAFSGPRQTLLAQQTVTATQRHHRSPQLGLGGQTQQVAWSRDGVAAR
jgi:hypothetical protein